MFEGLYDVHVRGHQLAQLATIARPEQPLKPVSTCSSLLARASLAVNTSLTCLLARVSDDAWACSMQRRWLLLPRRVLQRDPESYVGRVCSAPCWTYVVSNASSRFMHTLGYGSIECPAGYYCPAGTAAPSGTSNEHFSHRPPLAAITHTHSSPVAAHGRYFLVPRGHRSVRYRRLLLPRWHSVCNTVRLHRRQLLPGRSLRPCRYGSSEAGALHYATWQRRSYRATRHAQCRPSGPMHVPSLRNPGLLLPHRHRESNPVRYSPSSAKSSYLPSHPWIRSLTSVCAGVPTLSTAPVLASRLSCGLILSGWLRESIW